MPASGTVTARIISAGTSASDGFINGNKIDTRPQTARSSLHPSTRFRFGDGCGGGAPHPLWGPPLILCQARSSAATEGLSCRRLSRRLRAFAELLDADTQHPPERLRNQRRPAGQRGRGAEWVDAGGAGCPSRAACTFQFSSTYRTALAAWRGEASRWA